MPAPTPAPVDRCAHCGYPRAAGVCRRCRGVVRDGAPPHGEIRPGRGAALADFAQGFVAPFRATAWLLARPEYRGRLRAPLCASAVVVAAVGGGLAWLAFRGARRLTATLGELPDLAAPCATLGAAAIAILATAITLYFTLPLLVELALSPFLDPLAEATERAFARCDMPALDPSLLGGLVAGLRAAVQILAIQLLLWLPLVALSLTGIGAAVAFLVAAWLNALVWFEIPCTRRGYGLRARVRLLRYNRARALGLGAGFQIGMLIPVFNLVLLAPAAAVAASALYFHFDKTDSRETSLAVRIRPTPPTAGPPPAG
ncbi:MAG: EI24 domain-containing protein [Planctomycetes bacterium]|nr:EI24 domain-containing protein [Planctomycetota bacterium]